MFQKPDAFFEYIGNEFLDGMVLPETELNRSVDLQG